MEKDLRKLADDVKDAAIKKGVTITSVGDIDDEDPSFVVISLNTDDNFYDDADELDVAAETEATTKIQKALEECGIEHIWDESDERFIDYVLDSVQYDGDTYNIYLKEK